MPIMVEFWLFSCVIGELLWVRESVYVSYLEDLKENVGMEHIQHSPLSSPLFPLLSLW